MKYTVVFQDVSWSDLEDVPGNIRKRILKAIETRLSTQPTQYGLRLRQSLADLWKIRVGDYRVVYEMNKNEVKIWAVLHRKTVYPEVKRRWLQ